MLWSLQCTDSQMSQKSGRLLSANSELVSSFRFRRMGCVFKTTVTVVSNFELNSTHLFVKKNEIWLSLGNSSSYDFLTLTIWFSKQTLVKINVSYCITCSFSPLWKLSDLGYSTVLPSDTFYQKRASALSYSFISWWNNAIIKLNCLKTRRIPRLFFYCKKQIKFIQIFFECIYKSFE